MEAPVHLGSEEKSVDNREAQLVLAVLRKDRKATAEFVSLCSDWLYPFICRRLMPRTDLAEDLMQEILVSAWQNLPKFRGESALRAWIIGIGRHKIEDYYRRRIRQTEVQHDELRLTEPTFTPQIQEKLETASQNDRVQKTLACLPEAYGLALIWKYREEKSLREMANFTGKTEKAIERLLARARKSFKKRWNDDQT
jgi:RNA polymerase sigma-70 factor, ECF subfamily